MQEYGEKHLARVQARIRAVGDHLVEITSASGACRRVLEREGRALASAAAHQALDAENGHRCLPRQTQEVTRRAYMALEASGFSGRGQCGLLRCNSGQDGRTKTFFGCVRFDTATK